MKVEDAKNRRLKLVGNAKQTIIGCLVLGSLLICLTVAPLTYTQTSDPKSVGKAKPTPEEVLDEESAAELIEELKETLAEEIEDEDAVNEIVEKWEEQELVGKTRKEALKILFEDVKSVVEDKQMTDKIWESWSTNDDAQDQLEGAVTEVNRKAVLDNARKQFFIESEMTCRSLDDLNCKSFYKQTGNVKVFAKETGSYKGQTYTIYKEAADPNTPAKVAAIQEAVKTIIDKGIKIPQDLRVYCLNAKEAQVRAFARDEKWNQVAWIILGPSSIVGGRPDSMSAEGFGGFKKTTITVIHEIGHILHEKSLGDAFWASGSGVHGEPVLGGKVSGYANMSKKEFAAEVFAGTIIGKKFPADVLDEYAKYGGPQLPR